MRKNRTVRKIFLRRIAYGSALLSLAACLLLMVAKPTLALTCPMPSIQKSYEKADWVFLAEVLEARNIRNFSDHRDHIRLQKLKLKILKVWKGTPPEAMELEIITSKTVLIMASPTPLEARQSYIFALSGEQTIVPFSFRATGCESPWPASASEKEILWLNSTKGE